MEQKVTAITFLFHVFFYMHLCVKSILFDMCTECDYTNKCNKEKHFLKEDKNMGFIWSLIVGGILGAIAGMIVGKDVPGGIIGNIIVGFIGSWIGSSLLSDFGPIIGGFAIIPALIGAIILIFIFSLIVGRRKG